MRGGVTGGVLAFGQVGALMMPLVYSGLLNATGSYGIGFVVCGLPALLIGFRLMRAESPQLRSRVSARI
jgi:nitrate/nitrite transporter NarK